MAGLGRRWTQRMALGVAAVIGSALAYPAPSLWAADTTPPLTPTAPVEGPFPTWRIDYDYSARSSYWVSCYPTTDPESKIATYEFQERQAPDGSWTSLGLRPSVSFPINGRPQNTRWVYRVRAKNRTGLWSAWSPTSDGILVDMTPGSWVTVSDDGVATTSRTTLHAVWTPALDAESGIVKYEYQITETLPSVYKRRVGWTSVGLATEVTRTDLSLKNGGTYYFTIRATNGAGLVSWGASNGIRVEADTFPPVVKIAYPTNGTLLGAAN